MANPEPAHPEAPVAGGSVPARLVTDAGILIGAADAPLDDLALLRMADALRK